MAVSLAACSSLPPPTAELDGARQAISRAEDADADQYAADALAQARNGFARAQAAMADGRDAAARSAALLATADADLALAQSRAAVADAQVRQREAEIAELRTRLELGASASGDEAMAIPPPAAGVDAAQRLLALEADPRLNAHAAYERLQARQALDAAANARSSERAVAQELAGRRVAIAELSARTGATLARIDRLDRERSELLVEASRQDAARARAEAERLRMEAQIQLEEAQRLRAAAEAESMARQEAEEVIFDVAGEQAARLQAAREREAELARQEAALLAGGSLPPARTDARGEVYTLAGDAFGSGSANLTAAAAASVRVLAAYLQAGSGAILVEGHTDDEGQAEANQALSRRRAEAVRAALAEGGVAASRMKAAGRGEADPVADNGSAEGRARNRRVEIIVSGN
jgi:outer membrane protein OmpA-like peptidoglycan-associated protein